ncbi:YwqG family protein [Dactylosporangium sp. AC04546]|uniref:DUF1963 domain-containing protein n=1 Tax=Dactylosporangium sp. AC04546 TaxID=2862460 RepID=UPI001EE0A66F|nr:YwqG family protein [Dactylosporangium sp. AC04546]WVK80603.1 YwqG family protein [Dactylosporangium sp. AC04546]
MRLAWRKDVAVTGHRGELEQLARRWLAPGIADRFMALVRPAIRLCAPGPDDQPVGQLGGEPALPDGMPWPTWADDEPLSLVLAIGFDRLVGYEVDIDLPLAGSLLFFRPGPESARDPDPGARLIYVPPGTAVSRRRPPSGTYVYPLKRLAARTVLTWPHGCEPVLMAQFGSFAQADQVIWGQQRDGQSFQDALWRHQVVLDRGEPDHQIGGYACTVQNSIVYQAAGAALGHYNYQGAAFAAEAAMWTALLQVSEDTDVDMGWGDGALLYWAVRTTDLSARNFSRAYYETQGH